tara:strand:- start:4722 stop:6473 length:1752 start_codon:yes stop_codon:yes gene_type:complete
MLILGLNAYNADASAAILTNGELTAAVEEERFTRIKHSAGFPYQGVKFCVDSTNYGAQDLSHIAICRNPKAHFWEKVLFTILNRPNPVGVIDRLKANTKVLTLQDELQQSLNTQNPSFKPKLHKVEHHKAHIASAFYASPYEESAVFSVDGFGDFVSAMWGTGIGNKLNIDGAVKFPHSLGILYTAITQYLGLTKFGDEYKTMALAAYAEPNKLDFFRNLITTDPGKIGFHMDLKYFNHHKNVNSMQWLEGEPIIDNLYSPNLISALGQPPRHYEENMNEFHYGIAASLQRRLEEVVFDMLNKLYKKTGMKKLTMAGGVALNCTMNSKILDQTPFEELYIQPAAWDGGTSLGSALYVWHDILGNPRVQPMEHAYWGPSFDRNQISEVLEAYTEKIRLSGKTIQEVPDTQELCRITAEAISTGKIVGWFQGKTEFGPRALGNRSIIADPRRPDMREILNERIKLRETFRPFAPSILEEYVSEYFDTDGPAPYMLINANVKPDKRDMLPAVVHIDGTSRIQTVSRKSNPRYWDLISEFKKITGVPIILNTSFNENEPIVCTPSEALECFLRTNMDVLVLGDFILK